MHGEDMKLTLCIYSSARKFGFTSWYPHYARCM